MITLCSRYTREIQRPEALKIVGEDTFRPELMSGSFVARSVGDMFSKIQPGYSYKSATDNPINADNMVDDQEREILQDFQKNRNLKIKKGIIKRKNQDYFYIARPTVSKQRCNKCHGRREDAPKEQLQMYKGSGGYNYKPGEVVAMFITYVPIQKALAGLKTTALKTVLMGVGSILMILIAVWYFMNSAITKPIIKITQIAENISRGKDLGVEVQSKRKDEIGALYDSFNKMRKSVVLLIKRGQKKKQ